MAIYKNLSNTTKTFHGVTFKPGDVKEVPGIINHSQFIRMKAVPKEPPKRTESKPKDVPSKPDHTAESRQKLEGKSQPKVVDSAESKDVKGSEEQEVTKSENKEE